MLPALLSAKLWACTSPPRPWLAVDAGSSGSAWGWKHSQGTVLLPWHGKFIPARHLLALCPAGPTAHSKGVSRFLLSPGRTGGWLWGVSWSPRALCWWHWSLGAAPEPGRCCWGQQTRKHWCPGGLCLASSWPVNAAGLWGALTLPCLPGLGVLCLRCREPCSGRNWAKLRCSGLCWAQSRKPGLFSIKVGWHREFSIPFGL